MKERNNGAIPINKFERMTILKLTSSHPRERTATLYPGPPRRGLQARTEAPHSLRFRKCPREGVPLVSEIR
jgi:hypothetical protein